MRVVIKRVYFKKGECMANVYAYQIEVEIFKNNLRNYGRYKQKLKNIELEIEALENSMYGIKSTSIIKSGGGTTNPQVKINAHYGQLKKLEALNIEKDEVLLKIADIEKILKKIKDSEFKQAMIDVYAYGIRYEDVIKKYSIAYSVKGLYGCIDRLIINAIK